MEEWPVEGELEERNLCEPFISKEITWKIEDVFSLLRSSGTEVRSPEFSFANGTWVLCTKELKAIKLQRLMSSESEQDVYYKFFLKSSHGDELESRIGCEAFDSSWIDFESYILLSSSILDAYLEAVAPEDTVTVFFQMHAECTTVGTASQEEVAGPGQNLGELAERDECGPYISKEITWKIPKFSSLPSYYVRSPEFAFGNGTWILRMGRIDDSGESDEVSDSCTLFSLDRLQPLEGKEEVYFKFFLQTCDGQAHEDYFISCDSDTSSLEIWDMASSELDAMLTEIAPDDTLRFVCRMHMKSTAVEATSREEGVTSLRSLEIKVSQLTKVLCDFEKLLLSEDSSDVTLQVRGQNFPAHRAILSARSPVFASMMSHNMKEKNTGLIDIPDCDPEHFPDFLRFLYCGNVDSITSENACSLYRASDKYDVRDLKPECLAFMKTHLDVENFCDVITLAVQHNEADLVQQAIDFFAKNMLKILVTVKWQVFVTENPIQGNELTIRALSANKSSSP